MTNSRWWYGRKEATSIDPQRTGQVLFIWQQIRQPVGSLIEELAVKDRVFVVQVDGQGIDIGLDQILEEVGAKGGFRGGADTFAREFDQGAGVVDIAKTDLDAQVGVRSAPAPGPDTDEVCTFSSLAFKRPMALAHSARAAWLGRA